MSRVYAWVIDKDRLASDFDGIGDEAGTMGPYGADEVWLAALRDGEGLKFRMLDDDGEVYYEGRWIGRDYEAEDVDSLPMEAFGPLDDFGEGNAGCTMIQYKDKSGAWRML